MKKLLIIVCVVGILSACSKDFTNTTVLPMAATTGEYAVDVIEWISL